jgi:hypothetical protein
MASLQEIIDYSKANPTTPYAQKAYENIKSGGFDQQAEKEGIDLSWAGRPKSNIIKVAGTPIVGGETGAMVNRIGSDINETGKNVKEAITGTGNFADQGTLRRATGAVSEIASGVTKVASETLPEPIRQVVSKVGEVSSNVLNWLGEKLGSTKLAQDFVTNHPEATKALEEGAGTIANIGNIAGTIAIAGGAKAIAPKVEELATKGTNAISNVATGVKENIVTPLIEKTGALKEKLIPSESAESITGKVLQGKTGDISSGKSGLSQLDTSKIKTYKDLNTASASKIKEIAEKQDEILSKDTTPHKISEFEKIIGEGDNAVKINYVKQALDNLKELYTSTSDAEGLAKINTLLSKEAQSGLTVQEVNNLARNYGSEFGQKAFSKISGEPLTSVNATKFENIRSGLKNTARDLLPDEASKALDAQMTDLYTVKNLSKSMMEKVNTLTQRLQKPNILQKIGGIVGKGMRITGVGDLASKLLGIDKVPGASTLNAVELEAKLAKNLEKINKAMAKDDKGFVEDITKMANQ